MVLKIGIKVAGISNSAVDKIFHFTALPKDPTAYFDPKTGEYHSSKSSSNNGTTSSGGTQNTNGNSASTDTKTSENATATGQQIVEEAEKYIGRKLPYVWGGCSLETGADCSGFCWAILKKLGLYSGGRITTIGFETAGTEVPSLSEAQAGDMIVYGPGKGQSYHMAIYDGHGGIIHEADEQEDCNLLLFGISPKSSVRYFKNEDATGTIKIILADGMYIDKRSLKPRLQNAIRRLAAYSNPQFFIDCLEPIQVPNPVVHNLNGMHQHQCIDLPMGNQVRTDNRLTESRGSSQHTHIV